MRYFFIFTVLASLMISPLAYTATNGISYIKTKEAQDPLGAYSQGIAVDLSKGKLIFVAGQEAYDPKTKKISNENITVATRQALENIQAILKRAGSDLQYIVRTDAYLKDSKDADEFNKEYAKYFVHNHYPTRTIVQEGMANRLEISCIAYIPNKQTK